MADARTEKGSMCVSSEGGMTSTMSVFAGWDVDDGDDGCGVVFLRLCCVWDKR